MITIEQCRGARGLLAWTQQDLADASGLSKTAINNFEKGHSDIKAESARAIRMAFESADIEFIGAQGVSKKAESTHILRGVNAINELLCDMHTTLFGGNDEILISHVDQTLTSRIFTQKLVSHLDFIKTNQIRQRIITNQALPHLLSPDDECRWLPANEAIKAMPTFIYGSKIAFELWDQAMIILVNSAEAANAERNRFEQLWTTALSCEQVKETLKNKRQAS
ncbi:MAG: helix-turn-helix domain-containing protein [Bdellovibrionales bacterium]